MQRCSASGIADFQTTDGVRGGFHLGWWRYPAADF
jgi:hypothetical protein